MKDDRVFDLKHPGNTTPHASGRPVIVGHHPTMADPMLRPMTHASQPQPPYPTQPQPQHSPEPAGAPILPGGEPYVPPAPPAATPYAPTPSLFQTPPPAPTTVPIGSAAIFSAPTAPETTFAQPPSPQQQSTMQSQPTTTPIPGQIQSQPPTDQIQHATHHELPITEQKIGSSKLKKFLLILLLPLLLIGAGVYLAIDAQLINNKLALPFELFKEKTPVVDNSGESASVQNNTTPVSAIPPGYSAYNDSALPFSFNYPTSWGTPTVTTEQGFSKRGGENKSDGIYAYLVGFATNKDVQMAITSAEYLSPVRSAMYYDFLSWCLNPDDNKYYKSVMGVSSAAGVDTPAQIACNQGPLTDATKIDASTIVQADTKAADGSSLGDVYTKNLGDTSIPVVRIKDASRKNGNDIKIILNNDLASTTTNNTP